MAAEALSKARDLMGRSVDPKAPSSTRRAFFEHLIGLPKYPSYECKAYFGTFVAKYFAEFEDLQDKAVDAVLDLCEDESEKTRIVGIKGLGATAKADSKWVRGNAGVLLQLLECPPTELKHVKETLQLLLSISPADVFSVMADDCCGSEEETGASRRNILEYLEFEAKDIRREVLESGNNLSAESAFRRGFLDVVKASPPDEARLVLGLLLPLSTVSGKKATAETSTSFVRAITQSPSHTALIRLFDDYLDRRTPIDPRWVLVFLAKHGRNVVESALQRRDKSTLAFLDRLKSWVDRAISAFRNSGQFERDFSPGELIPGCTKRIIRAIGDVVEKLSSSAMDEAGIPLEILLWTVHRLMTVRDMRKEVIDKDDAKDLFDLSKDARKAAKRFPRNSVESEAWMNVQDICENLEEYRTPLEKIIPSWDTPPPSKSELKSTEKSKQPSAKDFAQSKSTTTKEKEPYQRPLTPPLPNAEAGPSKVRDPPPHMKAPKAPSTGDSKDPIIVELEDPIPPPKSMVTQKSRSLLDRLTPSRPSNGEEKTSTNSVSGGKDGGEATSSKGIELLGPPSKSAENSREGEELLGKPTSSEQSQKGKEIFIKKPITAETSSSTAETSQKSIGGLNGIRGASTRKPIPETPSTAIAISKPTQDPATTNNSPATTIKGSATALRISEIPQPQSQTPHRPTDYKPIELLPSKPDSTESPTPAPANASNLLGRLAPRSTSEKRSREGDNDVSSASTLIAGSSLLSRLGRSNGNGNGEKEDQQDHKRVKSDSPATSSLRARLAGLPSNPSSSNGNGIAASSGMSIRSSSGTPKPTTTELDPSIAAKGFSILNRSTPPAKPLTNISSSQSIKGSANRTVSQAKNDDSEDDAPIVRKGRGFQKDDEGDDLMTFVVKPPTEPKSKNNGTIGGAGNGSGKELMGNGLAARIQGISRS